MLTVTAGVAVLGIVYFTYQAWKSIMGFSDIKGLEIALEEARKGMCTNNLQRIK